MAKGAYVGVNNVARKIKKGYVGIENFTKRNLPAGYTQVEYIESDGTGYFDTGFTPNQDTRMVVDFEVLSTNTSESHISSARTNGGTPLWTLYYDGSKYATRYGTGAVQTISSPVGAGRHVFDKNKNVLSIDGKTVNTVTYATFTVASTLTIFCRNDGTAKNAHIKGRLRSYFLYDNGTLVRDYVTCVNSAGKAGLYDMVNGVFSAGVGTFTAGSTYKGVARKIIKAYIGIGGIARPCWGGGELAYYGTVTALGFAKWKLSATTVGNYALFASGLSGYVNGQSSVDAYNKSLIRSTPTASSARKYSGAATSVGIYALFGGGYLQTGACTGVVDAYNETLTRSTPTPLSSSRYELAAASVGDYAIFAGGEADYSVASSTVDAYNKSLTKTTLAPLTTARLGLAATTVGNYAIFARGKNGNGTQPTIDVYNGSGTKSVISTTSTAEESRVYLSATTIGDYAIFAGGQKNDRTSVARVDTIDKSLTLTTGMYLSVSRFVLSATTVGNYALFGGGRPSDTEAGVTTVDVYDQSLTKTTIAGLSEGRHTLAATTIGDYALFGGGYYGDGATATVDAYTVA